MSLLNLLECCVAGAFEFLVDAHHLDCVAACNGLLTLLDVRLECHLPKRASRPDLVVNRDDLLADEVALLLNAFDQIHYCLPRLRRPLRRQDQDTLRTQGRATLTHYEVYEELDSGLGECLLGPVGHWIYHHGRIIKHQRVASKRNHARRSASSLHTSIIAVEA